MKTVQTAARAEFIEKKSRFIGAACRVSTEDDALAFIERVRGEERVASHNVFAYVLEDGNRSRFSDDGEPSGTAGFPVLNVINQQRLKDTVVVVTRYFGGILLGAGGLVRAYTKTAALAIDAAGVIDLLPRRQLTVITPYALFDKLSYNLIQLAVTPTDITYEADITFHLLVKEEYADATAQTITDLTSALAIVEFGDIVVS